MRIPWSDFFIMLVVFFVATLFFEAIVCQNYCNNCDNQNGCINLGQHLVPIHRYCCFCDGDPRINHAYTVSQDFSYYSCKTESKFPENSLTFPDLVTAWPGGPGAALRATRPDILAQYCPRLIRIASFNNISASNYNGICSKVFSRLDPSIWRSRNCILLEQFSISNVGNTGILCPRSRLLQGLHASAFNRSYYSSK